VQVGVTGATGHIGANMVRALLAAGHEVRAVVHRETKALDGLAVTRVEADVCEPASLEGAFQGCEVVYHLAGMIALAGVPHRQIWAVNREGVRHVCAAALAAGVRRLVHFSSCHAYDLRIFGRPIDETHPRAVGAGLGHYDRSKAAGEEAVREAIGAGLDAVIINPTAVIGPYDFRPSRIGRVFQLLARGRLPLLLDGGFDWVDVRDLVAAGMAAAEHGRCGENYLVGGHWTSVKELAALVGEVLSRSVPQRVCPYPLARLGAPFGDALAWVVRREPLFTTESIRALRGNTHFDCRKAMAELNHAPRPLRETVADIYGFFADPQGFAAGALPTMGVPG